MPIGSWDTVPITFVRSDKDEHFREPLAQNAMEIESLEVPNYRATSEYIIESVSIIAKQRLEWDLFLWGSATPGPDANLDLDTFAGYLNFPLTQSKQIGGAGSWYQDAFGFAFAYRDLDEEGQIHVGLVNRSVAAKNAGATGEVVVQIKVRAIGFS